MKMWSFWLVAGVVSLTSVSLLWSQPPGGGGGTEELDPFDTEINSDSTTIGGTTGAGPSGGAITCLRYSNKDSCLSNFGTTTQASPCSSTPSSCTADFASCGTTIRLNPNYNTPYRGLEFSLGQVGMNVETKVINCVVEQECKCWWDTDDEKYICILRNFTVRQAYTALKKILPGNCTMN